MLITLSLKMMLLGWGANSHGQLGLDVVSEQVEKPTKIIVNHYDSSSKIKQIACGGGHTLLLTNTGQLFSCGWNYRKQLGTNTEVCNFQRVWNLSGINFTNIACGWDFSCGVTDDRFLFVWGCNSHGQLGLPKDEFPESVKPTRLHVNACAVSMGLRHTAIVNSKGEVWTTGCGKHGQLGLGKDILFSHKFQKVDKLGTISHIACGQRHTVAWSSNEKALYVWGDNKHNQLLLRFLNQKYDKIYIPEKIDIDVKEPVKKLLSGWSHVALLLENGRLYTWGANNYGQLGVSVQSCNKLNHIELPDGRKAIDIAVGSEHNICLASDNSVWAWGWNEHANTGITLQNQTDHHIDTPVPIPLDFNSIITGIYAGGAHNFIILEQTEES